jgi:hypothetical protein
MKLEAPTTFSIPGGVGLCNALRRTLLSDIETEAPTTVTVVRNVTCHTDEYLAHRIGQVPFRRVGNGSTMRLCATGPCSVTTDALVGPAFAPVHAHLPFVELGDGHALEMEVHLSTGKAREHARFSPCFAVSLREGDDGRMCLSLGSNDHRTPEELLLDALTHMDKRVERALQGLAQDHSHVRSYI